MPLLTNKKVFVSFDFDNDKFLKDSFIGQCKLKQSPFAIMDFSLKEASKEDDWEKKARKKIELADLLIVMLGKDTHKAPGVLKEIAIAKEFNKKIIQLIGYKDVKYKRIIGAGYLYKWKWEHIKKALE